MWERTLQDLIRGLRANKKDESKFIAQAVEEIRKEVRNKDMELKAAAVLKLTYLDMLGYDMSWASFHVVEVMSSPKIHLKTVGYLAATQSFNQDTDVLMLTTNLLKKDFASKAEEVAVTLNGFSHIVTPDLARDLGPDVIKMLTHSRAQIRKRAVLALYKVLIKYPELTQHAMVRLKERLDDPDSSVVSATVNVICELARQNPRDYLSLAPQLFHLLTTSSNNWMLIKIIKLFGTLTPHEPRLVKKLQPPITDLISTTPAISLLYECVHTCIIGGMLQGLSGLSLARTCVTKLANFLQDDDQNLKYIALMAMAKIVPTHPHLVAEYQGMIMSSVNDQDISIRIRALDLVSAMANRDNLQSIVQQLLSHLVRNDNALPSAAQSLAQHTTPLSSVNRVGSPSQNPAYRLILAQRILALCSQDTYDFITDFEWYLSVLVDLAYVANVDVGAQIRDQLMDITARVRAARRYSVQLMVKLLCDDTFLMNAEDEGSCAEALWAAAWICGEHCSELTEPQKLLDPLLRPEVFRLAPETSAVYLQAAIKVFGAWSADLADQWNDEELSKVKGVVDTMIERVTEFAANLDIEVQERAANFLQLLTFVRADISIFQPKHETNNIDFGEDGSSAFGMEDTPAEPRFPKSLYLVRPLFSAYELNPVAINAQAHVPVPEGLDLNAWIVPPPPEEGTVEVEDEDGFAVTKVKKGRKGKGKEPAGTKTKRKKRREDEMQGDILAPGVEETEEERAERERRKVERLERLRDDPFYLADDRPSRPKVDDVDAIPVVRLDDLPPLPQSSANSRLPSLRSTPRSTTPQTFVVDKVGEMPDFARKSQSPPANGNGAAAEVPDWEPRPPTSIPAQDAAAYGAPAPITVTRVKKKKRTGDGTKKKRTTTTAEL